MECLKVLRKGKDMGENLIKKFSSFVFSIILLCLLVATFTVFVACDLVEETPEQEVELAFNANRVFAFCRGVVSSRKEVGGLKENFLENAKTKDVAYLYENPESGEQELLFDSTLPEKLCYIIKSQEQAQEVFDTVPDVDFERQMLVILIYSTLDNASHKCIGVFKKESVLEVEMEVEYDKIKNGIQPQTVQMVCMFKMDKLDVGEVGLTLTNK